MSCLTRQDNCPECGADPFKVYDYDKKSREHAEISRMYRENIAQCALVRAKYELKLLESRESMKDLQRKTRKQSQVINRMEAKIKSLGEQPYKNEPTAASLEPHDLILNKTMVVTRVEYSGPDKIVITGQTPPSREENS